MANTYQRTTGPRVVVVMVLLIVIVAVCQDKDYSTELN